MLSNRVYKCKTVNGKIKKGIEVSKEVVGANGII